MRLGTPGRIPPADDLDSEEELEPDSESESPLPAAAAAVSIPSPVVPSATSSQEPVISTVVSPPEPVVPTPPEPSPLEPVAPAPPARGGLSSATAAKLEAARAKRLLKRGKAPSSTADRIEAMRTGQRAAAAPPPPPKPKPAPPPPKPKPQPASPSGMAIERAGFQVIGKRGALVRAGRELDTARVGEIPYGSRVVAVEKGWEKCGGERLRIVDPKAGWVSRKVLAPLGAGATAPRKPWRRAPPTKFVGGRRSRGGDEAAAPAACGGKRRSRRAMEALITPATYESTFLKLRCGACGVRATERFEAYSCVAATYMLGLVWCGACGCVLCERHLCAHTCDGDGPDPDTGAESAVETARAEHARAAAEEAALRKVQASAAAQLHHVTRAQRKALAAKASVVARWAHELYVRDPNARSDRLFSAFDSATRASELLWAEWEHPTVPGIAYETWARVVAARDEVARVTGEAPLDLGVELRRRVAVRVRYAATGGDAGDLDVLTDDYPDAAGGPRRDAWIHTVRSLVARQLGREAEDVTIAVVAVRDEDDATAHPAARPRY